MDLNPDVIEKVATDGAKQVEEYLSKVENKSNKSRITSLQMIPDNISLKENIKLKRTKKRKKITSEEKYERDEFFQNSTRRVVWRKCLTHFKCGCDDQKCKADSAKRIGRLYRLYGPFGLQNFKTNSEPDWHDERMASLRDLYAYFASDDRHWVEHEVEKQDREGSYKSLRDDLFNLAPGLNKTRCKTHEMIDCDNEKCKESLSDGYESLSMDQDKQIEFDSDDSQPFVHRKNEFEKKEEWRVLYMIHQHALKCKPAADLGLKTCKTHSTIDCDDEKCKESLSHGHESLSMDQDKQIEIDSDDSQSLVHRKNEFEKQEKDRRFLVMILEHALKCKAADLGLKKCKTHSTIDCDDEKCKESLSHGHDSLSMDKDKQIEIDSDDSQYLVHLNNKYEKLRRELRYRKFRDAHECKPAADLGLKKCKTHSTIDCDEEKCKESLSHGHESLSMDQDKQIEFDSDDSKPFSVYPHWFHVSNDREKQERMGSYRRFRDAHVFNPATNLIMIPETNKNESRRTTELSSMSFTEAKSSDVAISNPFISEAGTSQRVNAVALSDGSALIASTSQATGQLDQATDDKIYTDTKFTVEEQSDEGLSELSEFEYYGSDEELVDEDITPGKGPSQDGKPSNSREDSAVCNGPSDSQPQSNGVQSNGHTNGNSNGDSNGNSNGRKLRNSRPLPLKAATYELDKFSKNAMLIINQEDVEGYPELRFGTEDDVNALKKTFGNFSFEVEDHTDKTILEVFNILQEFSERDFTDYGCIAIAILTHGTRYGLLRAKDLNQMYSELTVLEFFNVSKNPTLLTKPIILIIQACRGDDDAIGHRTNSDLKIRKDLDAHTEPYYLPLHSDTLVLHSSFYGKPSFRPDKGSWFIQTLCEKISQLSPTLDLISIITEVQREVAIKKQLVDYNQNTKDIEINKQMPVMTSTLIRKLYLMKGDDENWPKPMQLQTYDTVDSACNVESDRVGSKETCSCFVGHFNYLKNCLSHFVDENPSEKKDSTALHLLKDANSIKGNYEGTKAKTTLIAISNFLENNSRFFSYHKYLYFYRVLEEHSGSHSSIWRRYSQSYVPIGAACIITSFFYKFVRQA